MAKKLYINFLWHMHQPYYMKPNSKNTLMPWVRLHGIKSYYDMPKLIREVSGIKVNFNIVPSLLEQIQEYVKGKTDDFLKVSRIDPQDLTKRQKKFILENFFQANYETMIKPYPRFNELKFKPREEYTDRDFLDLQVWYNLTWFGQWFKIHNNFIKELISKGRDYTVEEKHELLDLQLEVLDKLKEEYRSLVVRNEAELSTTPYYHPILPLLINTETAKRSMPDADLPAETFNYERDARWHVKEAKDFHSKMFGEKPIGIWPAEGAVNTETLNIFIENGFNWTATDEDILRNTLDEWNFESLYQPYRFKSDAGEIAVVFREHQLSDLIGFVYQKWDHKAAVNDFIGRLRDIKNRIDGEQGLVSIIMDGENAWEYYRENGWNFLLLLYETIRNEKDLEIITINDYLQKYPPKKELNTIHPGSWIYANYSTWIGEPIKNKAWEKLIRARTIIDKENKGVPRNLYIAEGSDWFWWYGEPHSSINDSLFDELFRSNLQKCYEELDMAVPVDLQTSLYLKEKGEVKPRGPIAPEINGIEDDSFEWREGAQFDTRRGYGTMHRVSKVMTKFIYGYDEKNLYFRWDYRDKNIQKQKIQILFKNGIDESKAEIDLAAQEGKIVNRAGKKVLKHKENLGCKEIIEVKIPRDYLGLELDKEIKLKWVLLGDDGIMEEWPYHDFLNLKISH